MTTTIHPTDHHHVSLGRLMALGLALVVAASLIATTAVLVHGAIVDRGGTTADPGAGSLIDAEPAAVAVPTQDTSLGYLFSEDVVAAYAGAAEGAGVDTSLGYLFSADIARLYASVDPAAVDEAFARPAS